MIIFLRVLSSFKSSMHPAVTRIRLQDENSRGFTLIELSIVMVIIGLIIGAILTGQDLINAAAIRAQLSQIEKYNTAVNSFYGKYGGLPGDLSYTLASQFGFVSRSGLVGHGDGNGILEGNYNGEDFGWAQNGENAFFWEDLSQAGVIDGTFNTVTDTAYISTINFTSSPRIQQILPAAKIGNNNYLLTFSLRSVGLNYSINYFGITVPTDINTLSTYTGIPGLSVQQAYAMDNKADDGIANSGLIQAYYVSTNYTFPPYYPAPNANPDTSLTCFNSSTGRYSVSQHSGGGVNCALQFLIQGAGNR